MLDIYKGHNDEETIRKMTKLGFKPVTDPDKFIFGNPYYHSGIYSDEFKWNASHLHDLYGLLHNVGHYGLGEFAPREDLFNEEERAVIREASSIVFKKSQQLKAESK